MLVIPKKDFPKDLNPLGLKRGDVVQIEVGDATMDFITLDPTTMHLTIARDPNEVRESPIKEPKPKKTDNMATMPLPDLKSMLQTPMPDALAAAPVAPPVPPIASTRG